MTTTTTARPINAYDVRDAVAAHSSWGATASALNAIVRGAVRLTAHDVRDAVAAHGSWSATATALNAVAAGLPLTDDPLTRESYPA